MGMRPMTPAEEDSAGLSSPDDCSICAAAPFHRCGGCGRLIAHHRGSTCFYCWLTIFDAMHDPNPEGTP